MAIELFGWRKENVSEVEFSDYRRAIREEVMPTLGFDFKRGQANLCGGFTDTYEDAGGSELHCLLALVTPDLHQRIPVHVNVFQVQSPLPERINEVRNYIGGFSRDLGYSSRLGLADSLSVV